MSRAAGIAAAAAVLALALLFARSWRIDYAYSIDFQTYWLAGTRVLHGEGAKLYDAGGGEAYGTPVPMDAAEFKNLPLVACAFAPLAAFDYLTAKRIFWWLSLAALLATGWIVGSWLVPAALGSAAVRVLGSMALLAAMAPAHVALRHGQTTPWAALAIAAALAFAARGRSTASGVALALACVLKFPPLALLAADAVRGRVRIAAVAAGVIAATAILSVVLFGPALHRAYVHGVASQAGTVMPGHNNQSVAAVVMRLSGPTPLHDWAPRPVPADRRIAVRLLAATLLAVAAWAVFARGAAASEATAVLAAGIVVLPVAWDHYLLMLAPCLLAHGGRALLDDVPNLVGTAAAYVLIAVPTPSRLLAGETTTGWLDALAVSHGFLGVVLALAVAVVAVRRRR